MAGADEVGVKRHGMHGGSIRRSWPTYGGYPSGAGFAVWLICQPPDVRSLIRDAAVFLPPNEIMRWCRNSRQGRVIDLSGSFQHAVVPLRLWCGLPQAAGLLPTSTSLPQWYL
jgi:hypothetical protein